MSRAPLDPRDLDEAVDGVPAGWDGLRGARLFVAGGTGFFGSWLMESLLRADARFGLGVEATVLTRNPERFRARSPHVAGHRAVRLHTGDVRDFEPPRARFTHVLHCGNASTDAPSDLEQFDVIVGGTRRMLDLAVQTGAKRFLFTSSGGIYGALPDGMTHVPEDHAGAPDPSSARNSYGQAKRAAEHLCALYHARHGVEPLVARGFAFVGPLLPLDKHFAVGNFIADGLAGRTVKVSGDGTPLRSYLYGSDLAAWLWTILLSGKPTRPYNVGSEAALSIAEVARTVAAQFDVSVEIAGQRVPGKQPDRYVPRTERARSELGVTERVDLADAIRRTANWLRS
jgi:dTDP-glucose 4,6-dehydratase